jgi:hypothetical protein
MLILVLYGLSGLFLYRLLNRPFGCGFAFLVLYGLAPFVTEGALWLSASSRVVVSVFPPPWADCSCRGRWIKKPGFGHGIFFRQSAVLFPV